MFRLFKKKADVGLQGHPVYTGNRPNDPIRNEARIGRLRLAIAQYEDRLKLGEISAELAVEKITSFNKELNYRVAVAALMEDKA